MSRRCKMNSMIFILVAVLAVATFPPFALSLDSKVVTSSTTTTEGSELDEPKILPLTDTNKNDVVKNVNEIWQEDDREVLIRNERGAKDSSGSGATTTTTGKKNKKEKNLNNRNVQKQQQQQQHLNKNTENANLETLSTTTQETIKNKNQHHSKHDKTNNSKKHNSSTVKPKVSEESKTKNFFYYFIYHFKFREDFIVH